VEHLGKCEICGKETKELYKCRVCGRRVCREHFRWGKGICVACEETMCEVCGRKLAVGYCARCGRLVCEDCSVERGPALLCIDCYRKFGTTL